MSGRVGKSRGTASNLEQATTTVNERILKECHNLYMDEQNGLITIANTLDLKLLPPRSLDKNCENEFEQGFSFVTSGRRRESLTGNATLHLYPHFKPLQEMPGVLDYLSTEISTSKQKKFPLVTFVDSPGLVDGDMSYPFDVNEAILWLSELCDLVFVFFDPIGQALCKRTLNIVEKISETHSEKMRFYLSKADEAGHESDRQRVMMQIVQELCKRPGLNRTGFDMPTIYIPNPTKPNRCVNQIEEVCKNTLNTLEKDCEKIGALVDEAIWRDNCAKSSNYRAVFKGGFLYVLSITLPLALLLNLFVGVVSEKFLQSMLGEGGYDMLKMYLAPVRTFWRGVPEEQRIYAGVFLILLAFLLVYLARASSKMTSTLSRKQKRTLLENQEYVQSVVKAKKKSLYTEYLQQTVSDHDL